VIDSARALAAEESGVTAVEYALIAAVIATMLSAAIPAIGLGLERTSHTVAGSLHGGPPTMGTRPPGIR
jgi:Flp pilus assembly pilin Flp